MTDPFGALGFPKRFDLDPTAVRTAHLRRTALLHPDRLTDPLARAEAERVLAELNQARDLLLDDERRANALLAALGGSPPESDRSLPDGFLVDMLEVREWMEEALASSDPARRSEVEAWADARRGEYRDEVARRFANAFAGVDDAGTTSSPALPPADAAQIRTLLNAWRYIERMIEQLA